MSNATSNALFRDIQTLFATGTLTGLSNRQLLDRFRDGAGPTAEAAFAGLVERHGPTVWRVCRQSLSNAADAEDAFQATFLVLARRASAIKKPESLGAWLHGVAVRTASCIRRAEGRRRRIEQDSAVTDEAFLTNESRDETRRVVHEEVARLPANVRDAVVLCYFEGLTHEQTAGRLGCPIGTVHSRIAWAKERLEVRLRGRQVTPSVVLFHAFDGTKFDVPLAVMARTVAAVCGKQTSLLKPLVAAVLHEATRITVMSKISLVMAGVATTLLVVASADPGWAAAPQKTASKSEGKVEVEIKLPEAKDNGHTNVSDKTPPERLPASARILEAQLAQALAARTRLERLFKANVAMVSAEDRDKAKNDLALIIAEIESQRDDLSDEVELLEAQIFVCEAALEAASEMRNSMEKEYAQIQALVNAGQSAQKLRTELAQSRGNQGIKKAELQVAKVRYHQAKRRLTAFDGLMKKVEQVNKLTDK